MKKIALALVAAGFSTAAAAGPLDYNHVTGVVNLGFGDANDETDTLATEGNFRLDSGLFFGGSLNYTDANGATTINGSAEAGIALSVLKGELALAASADYTDPETGDSDTNPTVRAQYTYSCENGRHYEVEYTHTILDENGVDDDNALILSVEGGDRNTWRYEAAFTREIEAETNGIGVNFVFPLAPQDQGEIVVGASNTWADDSNQDGYELQFGYRWNLD